MTDFENLFRSLGCVLISIVLIVCCAYQHYTFTNKL